MPSFQIEDIERSLPERHRLRIGNLALAWGAFDAIVSYWMTLAFMIPIDTGSILLGNMDTKTKLDRLEKFARHRQDAAQIRLIARIKKLHEAHVLVRNIVLHQRCAGFLRAEPDTLVFASIRHSTGKLGHFQVMALSVSEIVASTNFATRAERILHDRTEAMTKRKAG